MTSLNTWGQRGQGSLRHMYHNPDYSRTLWERTQCSLILHCWLPVLSELHVWRIPEQFAYIVVKWKNTQRCRRKAIFTQWHQDVFQLERPSNLRNHCGAGLNQNSPTYPGGLWEVAPPVKQTSTQKSAFSQYCSVISIKVWFSSFIFIYLFVVFVVPRPFWLSLSQPSLSWEEMVSRTSLCITGLML